MATDRGLQDAVDSFDASLSVSMDNLAKAIGGVELALLRIAEAISKHG